MDILYLATSSLRNPEPTDSLNRRGLPFGRICLAWLARRTRLQPMQWSPPLPPVRRWMRSTSRFALQTGASVLILRVALQSGGINAPDNQFCVQVSGAHSSQVESRTEIVNQGGSGVFCQTRKVRLGLRPAKKVRSAESRTCSNSPYGRILRASTVTWYSRSITSASVL